MASVLYRASPIDTSLHPPSPSSESHDLSSYNNATTSSIDTPPVSRQTATGTEGAYSTSQPSDALPDLGGVDKFGNHSGNGGSDFSGHGSIGPSLPGLSALASVASAPTSNLRYVPTNNLGAVVVYRGGLPSQFMYSCRYCFFFNGLCNSGTSFSSIISTRDQRRDMLTGSYACRASSSNANLSMGNQAYVTSSPAATTGGQGNNPVSVGISCCIDTGTWRWGSFLISRDRGLAPHHLKSLSPQPSNLPRSYHPSPILAPFHYQRYRLSPCLCLLACSLRHYGNRVF